MGVNWTKEQQSVIDLRDRNILVSAAAGSGKTAVLVERIITRIIKEQINIDELLIVTFTEAAAAEMKERILAAVEKQLIETPESEHLQRQTSLVHNASIMTTHSFCLSIIKAYFYKIDLDPVFRTGDESEIKLIQRDVMEELLELQYQELEEEFLNFVETFATGKSDSGIKDIILKLYEYSRSTPQPSRWMRKCLAKYENVDQVSFHKSDIGLEIFNDIRLELESAKMLLDQGIALCTENGDYEVFRRFVEKDLMNVNELIKCTSMIEMEPLIKSFAWARLSFKKDEKEAINPDAKKKFENYRAQIKSIVDKNIKEKYFSENIETQIEFINHNYKVVKELIRLVELFDRMYSKEKRSRHIIDYSDMEQFALKILNDEVGNELVPSEVAQEYQAKFKEIMIDEYQDSNLIQEAILTSVSTVSKGENNIFMVGDVKQSIYSFRLSRPELFIEKFDTYDISDGPKQRIDLHKNFRSREEVLEPTNFVFYKIMSGDLGEITYDKSSALNVGANYPAIDGNEMEFRILDLSDENLEAGCDIHELSKDTKLELEARDVALRINELMNSHKVVDKKTGKFRKLRYEDIVILSRSKKNWNEAFAKILEEENIPLEVESTAGYYDCWEISTLLNFINVIDNPKQDIPLAGVLTSVFGKLTSSELAIIKLKYPNYLFSDAVLKYAQSVDVEFPELQLKVKNCIDKINYYRDINTYASTYEVLWKIIEDTGYRHYVYSMEMGEQRLANVELLLQQALQYQKTSFKGLFNFIKYIDQLKKNEVEVSQATKEHGSTDMVRIMTIHKSKGLEFPIVFLVGCGKQFNEKDNKESVIIHPILGFGVDYINHQNRTKHKAIYKTLISSKKKMDNKGEELRVLYVAMTRAKEKLIVSGVTKELQKKLDQLDIMLPNKSGALSYFQRGSAITYLDWLLAALYHLPEFDQVKQEYGIKISVAHPDRKCRVPLVVKKITVGDLANRKIQQLAKKEDLSEELVTTLEVMKEDTIDHTSDVIERLTYKYPYLEEMNYKLKVSVTELKKVNMLEQEDAIEIKQKDKKFSPSEKVVPEFMKKEGAAINVATTRGNAFHRFMEIWDFNIEANVDNIKAFVLEQIETGRLVQEYRDFIDVENILVFLKSDLGLRMSQAARKALLFKEQPFVLGLSAKEIYGGESEETIILQGIIDVYFIENGEVYIVDYKTDKVGDITELKERYTEQLNLYARAVGKILNMPVKEKIIYSFAKAKSLVL